MKKEIHAVIGANYGDEGKGLVTDWLCSQLTQKSPMTQHPLVIRFNGGCQAGHSVIRHGSKHVFSHFGSGSLIGCPTYLAKDFIVNPFFFHTEYMDLATKWHREPIVFVSGECPITTIYEIMQNQVIEDIRDKDRHGSVGKGIFATIQRERHGLHFQVKDLFADEDIIDIKLKRIRLAFLGWFQNTVNVEIRNGFKLGERWLEFMENLDFVNERFKEYLKFFQIHIFGFDALKSYHIAPDISIVLEGAQGLGLSQSNMERNGGVTDYLTPSYTGSEFLVSFVKDIMENTADEQIISEIPEELDIHVHYVTRSYLTRHGRGPLEGAFTKALNYLSGFNLVDTTNHSDHPYQGELRKAPIIRKYFLERISTDQKLLNDAGIQHKNHIHVNFMDQTRDKFMYGIGGQDHSTYGEVETIRNDESFEKEFISEFINDEFGFEKPADFTVDRVYTHDTKKEFQTL